MQYQNTDPVLLKSVNSAFYEEYFDKVCKQYVGRNIEKADVAWVAVPAEEFDKYFSEDAHYDTWFCAVIVPKFITGSVDFRRTPCKLLEKPGAVWNITGNTLKFLK
jgi:hypothetical protein